MGLFLCHQRRSLQSPYKSIRFASILLIPRITPSVKSSAISIFTSRNIPSRMKFSVSLSLNLQILHSIESIKRFKRFGRLGERQRGQHGRAVPKEPARGEMERRAPERLCQAHSRAYSHPARLNRSHGTAHSRLNPTERLGNRRPRRGNRVRYQLHAPGAL